MTKVRTNTVIRATQDNQSIMMDYPKYVILISIFRCVARNIVGEAAATLRLNVVSQRSFMSHNNDHRIKEASMYSSVTTDTSFLKIEPEVLTADVGAKAHFTCQGNILDEITSQGIAQNSKHQSGIKQ